MPRLTSFVFVFISLIVASCSNTIGSGSYRDGTPSSFGGISLDERERPEEAPRRMRWEIWSFERDALGAPVQNSAIVRGDGYVRTGDRKSALAQYEEAAKQPLSAGEREGLTMRLAGVQLTLDQPERALAVLSNYFRSTGRGVAQVGPRFSLLFGYAYARKSDYNQSLAWFSRAQGVATPASGMMIEVEEAVKIVLATIDDKDFEKLAESWTGDDFIRTAIGEERSRRTSSPQIAAANFGKRPFWMDFEATGRQVPDLGGGLASSGSIGVILPLSGQFAALGTSVKNGIELAREGSAPGQPSLLAVRDTLGNATEAVTQTRQLLADAKVSAILGPLLSEEANAVSEVVVHSRVPMVSFSKRSDFRTGGNIFRIAPTAESQISSLLSTVMGPLNVKRFAVVAPDDAAGQEFATIFKEQVSARGGRIVYEAAYPKDNNATLLIGVSQEVERSGAEGIFFPDNLTAASRFFSNVSESARKRMRPLGLANWDNPRALVQSANALQGAMYVSPFYPDSARPMVRQFVDVYRAKFHATPDFLAAQGFDIASMLFNAFSRLAPGDSLEEALRSVGDFEGVTGKTAISDDGEFNRVFSVVELSEGKLREVVEVTAEGSSSVPMYRAVGDS